MATGPTGNHSGNGASQQTEDRKEPNWAGLLSAFFIGGVIVAVLLGLSINDHKQVEFEVMRSLAALLSAVGAAFVGGLLGFLFGIPRSPDGYGAGFDNQGSVDAARDRYLENTNLEQISDWLTKIIIGVALVQFQEISDAVMRFARDLGPTMLPLDQTTAAPLTLMFLIFFSILGFFFCYLWTRFHMANELTRSNVARRMLDTLKQEQESDKLAATRALVLVEEFLDNGNVDDKASVEEVAGAVQQADIATRTGIFYRTRDSRKKDFKSLRGIKKAAGSQVEADANGQALAVSMDRYRRRIGRAVPVFEALIAMEPDNSYRYYSQLAYALKDKAEPDFEKAAAKLGDAIRIRDRMGVKGYKIYEANLAECLIELEIIQGSSPELVQRIRSTIEAANFGAGELVLKDWAKLKSWLKANPEL